MCIQSARIVGLAFLLCPAWSAATEIAVNVGASGLTIQRELWGNNVAWSSFGSYYQSSNTLPEHLMNALRELGIPSLRYPGGCHADTFQWELAIGPKASRGNQWLNGCSAPAYQAGKAYFGVDEYLQLCEALGAEPHITLQYRSRDTTTRVQVETNYAVVTDAGTANIYVADFNLDDDRHVSFQDIGDAIKVTFSIPRDGYYRLNLRARAGYPSDPTAYWTSNAYNCLLDSAAISFTGDAGTLSAVDVDGFTIWGTSRSAVTYLRYGSHELRLTAQANWLKADYLEIRELNQDNSIKRAQAWVAYCNGHPADTRTIGVDQAGVDWKTVGYWATLRGQSTYGNHPEPYAVKIWEVGNEAWGPDPYGSTPGWDPNIYADAWIDYYNALRTLDPGLRISLCSNTPDSQGGPTSWPAVTIQRHGDKAEFLHYHPYYPFDRWSTDPLVLYKNGVTALAGLQTSLNLYRNLINTHWPARLGRLKIGASEWAAAYCWDGPNIDWAVRWTGAMCVADELGTMSRNLDLMESAQYWLLWSGNVCLFQAGTGANAPNGYYKHGLYEVFRHYSLYYGDRNLPCTVSGSPTYSFAGWGTSMPAGEYPMITAYASDDSLGYYLVVLNKDWQNAQPVNFSLSGLPDATNRVQVRTIQASSTLPNYADINTTAVRKINTTVSYLTPYQPSFTYTLPACSITGFVIEKAKPGNWLWRREAEAVHTVYRDVSPFGNVYRSDPWNYDSGGHVAMNDVGDAVVIPFDVPEEGYYTLRLRHRSGHSSANDAYWTGNAYAHAIDNVAVTFTGQAGTFSGIDADSHTVWGTSQLTGRYLSGGRHYLRITVNALGYGKVDWLEVQREQITNVEADTSYTIVTNNSGMIGLSNLGLDSGNHLSFHAGDEVSINFSVPYAGYYDLEIRQRTGVTPSTTSQFAFYQYKLDGYATSGTIDMNSISRVDADAYTYWGTVRFPRTYLAAGAHALRVKLTGSSYGKLDYLTARWILGPGVRITSPTTEPTYSTTAATVDLAGSATADVTGVTWANSRGGSGACTGTTSWSASNILLLPGANDLTITATGSDGTTTSDTLTVTFNCTAPAISTHPTSRTICSGTTTSFTVGASGTPTPTYQWYKGATAVTNGGRLSGATTATLTVTNADTSDAGSYSCTATNNCGSAASNAATLTVNPSPVAPTSASVDRNNFCAGDPGNISLSATGGSGATLRWFTGSCGGTSIGTGTPLSIASPTAATTYYARWETASCGNSACAGVAVNVAANPAPAAVCKNAALTLSNGTATLNTTAVDNGSTANAGCGQSISSRQLARGSVACGAAGFGSSLSFGCGDVGQQTVTLRVTQTDGQTACCTSTVTVADTDSDHDGTADCTDGCVNDPNKTAPGQCGCGVADADADSDGVADCRDTCPNTVPGATVDANGCPPLLAADFNRDGDVDQDDFGHFQSCMTGPALGPPALGCDDADLDGDDDVDMSDYGILQRCLSGPGIPASPSCGH